MNAVLQELRAWQRREWLYQAAAGAMYVGLIILVLLGFACAIDLAIDRTRDTPPTLRTALSVGQLVVAAVAAWWLVGRVRAPSVDTLAQEAEAVYPAFGHRLVTAVQLGRAPEKTAGMSAPLLNQVQREAEAVAARSSLRSLADAAPLGWAAGALLPAVVAWAGFVALKPELARVLIERQLFAEVAIPTAVTLTNLTPEVLPAGEPAPVRVAVSGAVLEGTTGRLVVEPDGEPGDSFLLVAEPKPDAEGRLIYAGIVPAGVPAFEFRAYLAGGRLRTPGRVSFAVRPAVTGVNAFLILPRYVDPTGTREYRRHQPQGEVYALPDCSVDVEAEFSKPVRTGFVRFVRRDTNGTETELSRVPLTLTPDGQSGSARAVLPAGVTGYRVDGIDEHGFGAQYPPYRAVTVAPDRPPEVALLPEVLKDPKEPGPIDDFLVDGMPLRLGGQVQVGYTARSPLGLSRAYLVYRVNEGAWTPLPLTPATADLEQVGEFVPELGVFTESGPFGQVEFYPIPAQDPEAEPSGLQAGGRFNFQTAALKKRLPGATADVPIEIGDTVEIRVAVYDRHPAAARPPTVPPALSGQDARPPADTRRPAGWSPESRLKPVVSDARFEAWRQEHYRTRVKIAELEQKQRDVFRTPE